MLRLEVEFLGWVFVKNTGNQSVPDIWDLYTGNPLHSVSMEYQELNWFPVFFTILGVDRFPVLHTIVLGIDNSQKLNRETQTSTQIN